jgi:hypothetical protein
VILIVLLNFARDYARKRPLTTGLFVLFLLALPILLYLAWSLYTETPTQLPIDVIGNGRLQPLKNIAINIRHTGRRNDVVNVVLGVQDVIEPSSFFIVSMPKEYRYVGPDTFAASWHHHTFAPDRNTTWHYFKPIAPVPIRTIRTDFEGPLFAGGATVNAHIFISTVFNAGAIDVPTTLTISGLHEFVLDDVMPEPDERQPGYVTYVASSWRERTIGQAVNLRGVDRAAASRAQYWLFVVATLIGVAVSVVAAGLQAFVSEYEQNHMGSDSAGQK